MPEKKFNLQDTGLQSALGVQQKEGIPREAEQTQILPGEGVDLEQGYLPIQTDFLAQQQKGLDAYKGSQQAWTSQAANAVGRVALNTIPTVIGNVASILDFEDYLNQDKEVGNSITNAMEELKASFNKTLPIYRTSDEHLDLGDSGWWFENGAGLGESMAAFAATGYGLGSTLSWLNGVAKLGKAGQAAATGLTALGLNQAESITTAGQVYKDTFEFQTQKGLSVDEAQQKAADAASYSINLNRANIALNLTSAGMFVRAPKLTRQIIKNVSKANTLKQGGLEALQEIGEEEINLIAEKAGKAKGEDRNFGISQALDNVLSAEGVETGLLGALGGFGQTVLSAGINSISGKNTEQKARFLAQQEALSNIENITKANKIPDAASTFKNAYELGNLYKQIQVIDQVDNPSPELLQSRKKLTDSILEYQSHNAFSTGTTDGLLEQYDKIKNLSPEEAIAKGLHDGVTPLTNPDHYINKANKATEKINELEQVYTEAQGYQNNEEVFFNRANDLALKENREQRLGILNNNKNQAQIDIESKVQSGELSISKGDATIYYNIDNLQENPFTIPSERKLYEEFKAKVFSIPSVRQYEKTKQDYKNIESEITENDTEFNTLTDPKVQQKVKQDKETLKENKRTAKEQATERAITSEEEAGQEIEPTEIKLPEGFRVADQEEILPAGYTHYLNYKGTGLNVTNAPAKETTVKAQPVKEAVLSPDLQKQKDTELANLEQAYDLEQISDEDYAKSKQAIEDKYKTQEPKVQESKEEKPSTSNKEEIVKSLQDIDADLLQELKVLSTKSLITDANTIAENTNTAKGEAFTNFENINKNTTFEENFVYFKKCKI